MGDPYGYFGSGQKQYYYSGYEVNPQMIWSGLNQVGTPLVLDCGSAWTRIGVAGELEPRGVFGTVVGRPLDHDLMKQKKKKKEEKKKQREERRKSSNSHEGEEDAVEREKEKDTDMDKKKKKKKKRQGSSAEEEEEERGGGGDDREEQEEQVWVGDDAMLNADRLRLSNPIARGSVRQWHDMAHIWASAMLDSRNIGMEFDDYYDSLANHPLMILQSPFVTSAERSQVAEAVFESFGIPALHLANASLMPLYSVGRATGVVVDSGEGVTRVVPVIEGRPIMSACRVSFLGGIDITMSLENKLNAKGNVFATKADRLVVRQIKERFSEFIDLQNASPAAKREVPYMLPGGPTIPIGMEAYECVEAMFNPEELGLEHAAMALDWQIYDSILACPADVQATLKKRIQLAGGNTLINGLPNRLGAQLSKIDKSPSPARQPPVTISPGRVANAYSRKSDGFFYSTSEYQTTKDGRFVHGLERGFGDHERDFSSEYQNNDRGSGGEGGEGEGEAPPVFETGTPKNKDQNQAASGAAGAAGAAAAKGKGSEPDQQQDQDRGSKSRGSFLVSMRPSNLFNWPRKGDKDKQKDKASQSKGDGGKGKGRRKQEEEEEESDDDGGDDDSDEGGKYDAATAATATRSSKLGVLSRTKGEYKGRRRSSELTNSPSTGRIGILAPHNRHHASWIGGSIVASGAYSSNIWVSREMYNEMGPQYLTAHFEDETGAWFQS